MRTSEGGCETFASIAPPNVDEEFLYERTEISKRKCLVDEHEKKEEEKEEMRTREKGGWMGNDSRMKQFLNLVDSSKDRARSIKADRSREEKTVVVVFLKE